MNKIKSFKLFLESYNKEYILNNDDVNKLFDIELDNLSPIDDDYTEEDYENFLNEYVGKTVWDYCKLRYPDEPETQYELAIKYLNK